MYILLGIFLILHGIAHAVGFVAAFRLKADIGYSTRILGGQVDVGDGGTQALGLIWLLTGLGFAVVGIGAIAHAGWALSGTLAMAAVSLVLCVVGWPQARIGVFINAALVVLASVLLALA